MNRLIKSTLLAAVSAGLLIGTASVMAQPAGGGGGGGGGGRQRGNFDPAQMQQRMLERVKEYLEITSDDDWKAISPLVEKVNTVRFENMRGGFGGFGGMGRRGGGPGGPGGGGPGGQAPELTGTIGELQKALDGKASNNELKTVMAKLADERKANEAKLTKAQEDLRKVLSVRQEALAVFNGLIPAASK